MVRISAIAFSCVVATMGFTGEMKLPSQEALSLKRINEFWKVQSG